MKGLFKKEFYVSLSYFRYTLVLMVIYAFMFYKNINTFTTIFMIMGILSPVISNLTYDESTGWDAYACSLPVSRRQVLAVRYALPTLWWFIIFVFLFTMVPMLRSSYMAQYGMTKAEVSSMMISQASGIILVGVVMNRVTIPMITAFGSIKGRYMAIAAIMILGGGIGFAAASLISRISDFSSLGDFLSGLNPYIFISAFVLAVAAIYLISYFLCLYLYKKKDL